LTKDLEFKLIQPDATLSEFVDSFWMLINHADEAKEIVTLPDGKVDILFCYAETEPFHTMLMDLDRQSSQVMFKPKSFIFAVSFKLLAVEYVLETSIAKQLNVPLLLPADFWDINRKDLDNFENFTKKIADKIHHILKGKIIDERKRKLFNAIYLSNGAITVKELADKSAWTSRQINRYFNQYIGVPLKEYCNFLRFQASLPQIIRGKFFPEQNYADQAHFIKTIKRHSGLTPKELNKNENDRFVQFLALAKK